MKSFSFYSGVFAVLIGFLSATAVAGPAASRPRLPFDFDSLRKIDEVQFGNLQGREHKILPEGAKTEVLSILGREALTMTNAPGSGFCGVAVRLGAGKGMKAGVPYVLRFQYPEDAPRSYVIWNSSTRTRIGFHTGISIGDALRMPYVFPNPESIDYPLSQKWESWTTVFEPHPRYPDFPKPGNPTQTPDKGFWVVITHVNYDNDPTSAGMALGTLSLYEAPVQERLDMTVRRPPSGLPQRHLFWREEMSDGFLTDDKNPSFTREHAADWYEGKMHLAKFLGYDTFSRDLLEFGHNQGWDSSKFGSNDWVYQSPRPELWHKVVQLATKYGLNILPMYEYCGSMGGKLALGPQKRAKTLGNQHKGPNGRDDYTHIWWSEKGNIDVTDPDAVEDLRKILEITITDEKANGNFIGAWLRPRSAAFPISFSDRCIELFSKETSTPATRDTLRSDKGLYQKYIQWWNLKRRDYLCTIRDYLRKPEVVGEDAVLLFTGDPSEPGNLIAFGGIVTDDPARFPKDKTKTPEQVVSEHLGLKKLTAPADTWGPWEWQHAIPAADPQNYSKTPGVMQTVAFNRLYSVADTSVFRNFRTPDGLAMIRHYPLNEHVIKNDDLGYYITDVEVGGPYCMLAEARALANGDPRFIGYLTSNNMQRGFPEYVRAFNQAFLALPALPSTLLKDAASNPEVVVRAIRTPKNGNWFAIINTSLKDAVDVRLHEKLAAIPGMRDYITTKAVDPKAPLTLYPGQVLVWHSMNWIR